MDNEYKKYIFKEIVSFEKNLNLSLKIFDEYRKINCANKLIQENPTNWEYSIIEQCKKNELDAREKYWIQYYDSYKNGFNKFFPDENVNKSNLIHPFDISHEVSKKIEPEKTSRDSLNTTYIEQNLKKVLIIKNI